MKKGLNTKEHHLEDIIKLNWNIIISANMKLTFYVRSLRYVVVTGTGKNCVMEM